MKKTILASSLLILLGPSVAFSGEVDHTMREKTPPDSTFFKQDREFFHQNNLPMLSAQLHNQESNSQNASPQNASFEQVWTAQEISQLEQLQSKAPSERFHPLTSYEQAVLQDLEEFNKHFSEENLRGYTSGGPHKRQGIPFDASMDTYFVDENNEVVALYNDHENPDRLMLDWSGNADTTYMLTSWEREIVPQAVHYEPWVMAKIKDTSLALSTKLQEARNAGQPYLLWVNVPSFTLRMYDTQTEEMVAQSRVIVGASGTQTPIFSTNIVNLKFNPDWSPPPSLQRRGKRYTPPGDNNPLGQVRFSADNNMNIYLHDTNNHELFNQEVRALSAGCVRVENWHVISQYLGNLTPEEVDERTAGNKTNFLDIPDSKAWISYERIDMDENGQMKLYGDIYRKQPLPQNELPRAIQ